MKRANLIPALRMEKRSRLRRIKTWATVLACYGAVVGGAYAACFAFGAEQDGNILNQIRKSTERFRKAGKEIHSLRKALAEASGQIAASRALAQNPDWSLLLAMVSKDLGNDVVLERCFLAPLDSGRGDEPAPRSADPTAGQVLYQKYTLDLTGYAKTQMSVSQFVLRLERSGLFESVRLIKTQKKDFMDGQAVAFRIVCELSGKGDGER